jgi:adhesin transport system membrane fusion protein
MKAKKTPSKVKKLTVWSCQKARKRDKFLCKTVSKIHLWLRLAVDALQLIIYPRFNRSIMALAHYLQRFYKSIAEKPEDAWLKPVAGAHLTTVKASASIVGCIIMTLFVVFLIWANVFEIDEYVHAQGKIEPESEIKTMSHFEGGVVQGIFVKEGDRVKENQILLQLKNTAAKATYDENLYNYFFHWAQILRLKAQIDQKPLEVPLEIQGHFPAIAKDAKKHYDNRMSAYQNEVEILRDGLNVKKSDLEELVKKMGHLEKLLSLSTERTEMLGTLMEQKLLAKSQFIQSKIDTASRTMEFESVKINIVKSRAFVQESRDKLAQIRLRYDMEDWQELKEQGLKFRESIKVITATKDQIERTDIRSPVNGIVKQLFVHTIGTAITSGKELISVVPVKDTLLVEVYVAPQDIGFIQKGEKARVKVTAYDYSIFGSLEGTVEKVSADTIEDPKDPKNTYFRVHIRTQKSNIEHHGKSYTLMPGETVQADILTAKRTVMQYLLKPIIKSFSDSLRER